MLVVGKKYNIKHPDIESVEIVDTCGKPPYMFRAYLHFKTGHVSFTSYTKFGRCRTGVNGRYDIKFGVFSGVKKWLLTKIKKEF